LNSLRVIFIGTSSFALPSLEELYYSNHRITGVITQPDRPKGRGYRNTSPPIKENAINLGLTIYQPLDLEEEWLLEKLTELEPHLIIVAAYGKLLPEKILSFPSRGCINLHPSLLPQYRGAAPIQRAIMNGERLTGISVIRMGTELDAGDIILQEEELIYEEDTFGELHHRLSNKGARLLLKGVNQISENTEQLMPQDTTKASYAPPIKKSDEVINWKRSSRDLFNQIRALYPSPGAYTFFRERRLKIWDARVSKNYICGKPGEIISVDQQGIEVATGEGSLILMEVQPEGKKKMDAVSFSSGYQPKPGEILSKTNGGK